MMKCTIENFDDTLVYLILHDSVQNARFKNMNFSVDCLSTSIRNEPAAFGLHVWFISMDPIY